MKYLPIYLLGVFTGAMVMVAVMSALSQNDISGRIDISSQSYVSRKEIHDVLAEYHKSFDEVLRRMKKYDENYAPPAQLPRAVVERAP